MARIRYTLTTTTTCCPHCGYTFKKRTRGAFAPVIYCMWFITLPVIIPYFLIRFLGLGDPSIPKIGQKIIMCPECSLPVRTDKFAIEDLDPDALITYRFRIWFYISYFLGAIFSFSLLYLIIDGLPIVSNCGLIALISLIGVLTIIIVYRIKLANCNGDKYNSFITQGNNVTKSAENHFTNGEREYFYCRKCGNNLPVDSQFCDKCGTKVVK